MHIKHPYWSCWRIFIWKIFSWKSALTFFTCRIFLVIYVYLLRILIISLVFSALAKKPVTASWIFQLWSRCRSKILLSIYSVLIRWSVSSTSWSVLILLRWLKSLIGFYILILKQNCWLCLKKLFWLWSILFFWIFITSFLGLTKSSLLRISSIAFPRSWSWLWPYFLGRISKLSLKILDILYLLIHFKFLIFIT